MNWKLVMGRMKQHGSRTILYDTTAHPRTGPDIELPQTGRVCATKSEAFRLGKGSSDRALFPAVAEAC